MVISDWSLVNGQNSLAHGIVHFNSALLTQNLPTLHSGRQAYLCCASAGKPTFTSFWQAGS
jgi:hypothetical protein